MRALPCGRSGRSAFSTAALMEFWRLDRRARAAPLSRWFHELACKQRQPWLGSWLMNTLACEATALAEDDLVDLWLELARDIIEQAKTTRERPASGLRPADRDLADVHRPRSPDDPPPLDVPAST